jgi:hypothetical protein
LRRAVDLKRLGRSIAAWVFYTGGSRILCGWNIGSGIRLRCFKEKKSDLRIRFCSPYKWLTISTGYRNKNSRARLVCICTVKLVWLLYLWLKFFDSSTTDDLRPFRKTFIPLKLSQRVGGSSETLRES